MPDHGTEPSSRAPAPRPSRVRVLLLLPFVAMLWVPSYNTISPAWLGVPFFYWYQLLWVPLTAVLIGIVYRAEH